MPFSQTYNDIQRSSKVGSIKSCSEQNHLLQRLRDKPFWIWNETEHKRKDISHKGDCCFNHMVGLPKMDNNEKPLFDYEKLLYDSLLNETFKAHFISVKSGTYF